MKITFIQDILLIQEPAAYKFYKEIMVICGYFVAPFFSIALVLEYFGTMDFGGVLKRLLFIVIVMNSFFYIHTTASDASLEFASSTLKKISPRNLFMKKWTEKKVRSKLPSGWDYFWIGNLKDNINDLYATGLFLLSKILFILLKLIYSTIYHLNYAFAGYTALCYFFNWTQGALRGTILTMVWCILEPFVLVGVLCIVGSSFDESALKGEIVGSGVDHMAWLFGVSLLIIATPAITYSIITGGGVQGAGAKVSEIVVGAGLKGAAFMKASAMSRAPSGFKVLGLREKWNKDKSSGLKGKEGQNHFQQKKEHQKDSGKNLSQDKATKTHEKNDRLNQSKQSFMKSNQNRKQAQTRNEVPRKQKEAQKASANQLKNNISHNSQKQQTSSIPVNAKPAQDLRFKRKDQDEIRPVSRNIQQSWKTPQQVTSRPSEMRKQKQENYNEHLRKKFNGRLPRIQL